jgi:hypothetical protein
MRRQESPEITSKSAGRYEAGMRSEMQTNHRQRLGDPNSNLRSAPPAVAALGGDGAAHRMYQNDMPPLPGTRRCTARKHWSLVIRVHGGVRAHFLKRVVSNA